LLIFIFKKSGNFDLNNFNNPKKIKFPQKIDVNEIYCGFTHTFINFTKNFGIIIKNFFIILKLI
jgi:hypothetical protein